MHRHGYEGKKLGRERDQRRLLVRGLATSLVVEGHIETTLPKAKVVVPYAEKLITQAKKGGLHSRRKVISGLDTVAAGHKLVDEIVPKTKRTSGHLRIVKTSLRRGDNAQLARVEFVDDLSVPVAAPKTTKPKAAPAKKAPAKTAAKKPAAKPKTGAKK